MQALIAEAAGMVEHGVKDRRDTVQVRKIDDRHQLPRMAIKAGLAESRGCAIQQNPAMTGAAPLRLVRPVVSRLQPFG
jgi:hypothetical protein